MYYRKNKNKKKNKYIYVILALILIIVILIFCNMLKKHFSQKEYTKLQKNQNTSVVPPKPKEKWKYIQKLKDL